MKNSFFLSVCVCITRGAVGDLYPSVGTADDSLDLVLQSADNATIMMDNIDLPKHVNRTLESFEQISGLENQILALQALISELNTTIQNGINPPPTLEPTSVPTGSPTPHCYGTPDPAICVNLDCADFASTCPATCGTCSEYPTPAPTSAPTYETFEPFSCLKCSSISGNQCPNNDYYAIQYYGQPMMCGYSTEDYLITTSSATGCQNYANHYNTVANGTYIHLDTTTSGNNYGGTNFAFGFRFYTSNYQGLGYGTNYNMYYTYSGTDMCKLEGNPAPMITALKVRNTRPLSQLVAMRQAGIPGY